MKKTEPAARVCRYQSFTDDFVESRNQDMALPPDYVWIKTGFFHRLWSGFLYGLAVAFAYIYGGLCLGLRVERHADLRRFRDTGVVVYGNHTQPLGDVFFPARVCLPKRIYTLAAPANLGIPVIGKILPALGALPIPSGVHAMSGFLAAVNRRLEERKCVVVYPEAHVWPWYTEIRPFPTSAFSFPIDANVPCFCATSTYHRRKRGGKPRMTIHLDGPFYPDESLPRPARKARLRDEIHACMTERSKLSDCRYIEYLPADSPEA